MLDFAPWTAEFLDGSKLSLLDDENIKFSAVINRVGELHTFTIHFIAKWDVAVRLTDGRYNAGSLNWFNSPDAAFLPYNAKFNLNYFRRCSGIFDGHKIESRIQGYGLGWECGSVNSTMLLSPDGRSWRWI